MALHILKLCVGVENVADLESWIEESLAQRRRMGRPEEMTHTTRMVPKRIAEIVGAGSLYWVIKGQVMCRQGIVDIRPFKDQDGISRCHLVLAPRLQPVEPRHCRPFQGWRYLADGDKPRDLPSGQGITELPEELRRELAGLGLL